MSTFIAPHKAIQAHIDRAYSINVMYRAAIKAPHAITPQPKVEAAPVIATVARPMPGTPLTIHQVYTPPQMGRQKRDLRIVASNRQPRPYLVYHYDSSKVTWEADKGVVFTPITITDMLWPRTPDRPFRSHHTDNGGLRRHREGC